MRSIRNGRRTRRPASSRTSRLSSVEKELRFGWREHDAVPMVSVATVRSASLPQETLSFKIKIPSPFCHPKADRLATGSLFREEFPLRPEHLFAGVQKLQPHSGRSPGFDHREATIFTVARPRGILTRFPILPALMRDTRTLLKEPGAQRSVNAVATYHGHQLKSKVSDLGLS